MEKQTINNLKGEVRFRKILAKQHVTGEELLPDYYGKEEHDNILLERIDKTRRDLAKLEIHGSEVSPFLEMGAERCHRSLVLTNDYDAQGFAIDISLDQLKTAGHFASLFSLPKLPVRVCCDANCLPFRDNSFPFVFSYEFLHHFPSPKPIIKEIFRVMSKGLFFLDEEPFKTPRIPLYKQKNKIYSRTTLAKSKVIRFIERYLSIPHCDEREYGIIENTDIPLKEWIRSLSVFDSRRTVLNSSLNIRSELGNNLNIRNLPNMFLGGSITGICRKEMQEKQEFLNLLEMLICPNCQYQNDDEIVNHPPLIKKINSFKCEICSSVFPEVEGVIVLLPYHLMNELYPEIEIR